MSATEKILGIAFFNGSVDEAVETMSANRGLLVVPAAPALVKVCDDEGYRRAVVAAEMAIADSGAMVLLWKIFTGRTVERISGLKFLRRLVERLKAQPNERVFWVLPSEIARAKTMTWMRSAGLRADESDLYVAPRYAADVRDEALLAKLENNPPAHVIVGIGGGTQEKLGLSLRDNLRAKPAIHCIGAALAFLTGDQPPIPMWADRFYLGWFLRLVRQPRLYGPRYLSALKLPFLIARYREALPPFRGG